MTTLASILNVVARFLNPEEPTAQKRGMARATLVVDENLEGLVTALKEANFRVLQPKKGTPDDEIKENLLSHRILITRNTKDFRDDAPVYDYGIIALEGLTFIDPAREYKDNSTAKMISKALSDYKLISIHTGFVLHLRSNGKHVLERMQ